MPLLECARSACDVIKPSELTSTWQARFKGWFVEGIQDPVGPHARPQHTTSWWKVMCLTGVDYFSTLGYQPSIAFLAAGFLSPFATLVLVLVTLLGALPMYMRVAELSPHGQGSILMLEEIFPRWRGKALVLCLLGFAATSFVITITLSAADATAHLVENPFFADWGRQRVLVTLGLLLALGAIFLKGLREAVGLAVVLVVLYLGLNVVVLSWGVNHILGHPELLTAWEDALSRERGGNPWLMAVMAVWLFPKLALGLSGFETGVAVMPLVRGDPDDTERAPLGRIRNAKKLLASAAGIMSVMLLTSSVVTTFLIPADAFKPGGPANGRAIAYLAHEHFGETFGSLYDLSTIAILWFAGASAMAGLLNLVPRYLPRYGMAPEWARATRPLVVIITAITILVTIVFDADVDAQGGAYATGVLMLMTSGAVAVTMTSRRDHWRFLAFLAVTIVFSYTTIVNIVERPEGIKIASVFIVTIIATSLVSRVLRSTELRVQGVDFDEVATMFVRDVTGPSIRLIANRPDTGDPAEYEGKLAEARDSHHLPPDERVLFLEVYLSDASDFSNVLKVRGISVDRFQVLRCASPAVPNAIAAMLLEIRDRTNRLPHAYFGWTEGNPVTYLLKFLMFGEGDTAPVTREVLRQVEPDPSRRPRVHVG